MYFHIPRIRGYSCEFVAKIFFKGNHIGKINYLGRNIHV